MYVQVSTAQGILLFIFSRAVAYCWLWSLKIKNLYRPHSEGMGRVMFSQVSVCSHFGGGVPTLDRGVPTLDGGGVPTLDGGGGTYLG